MWIMAALTGGSLHRIPPVFLLQRRPVLCVAGQTELHIIRCKEVTFIRAVREVAGPARVCLKHLVHHLFRKHVLIVTQIADAVAFPMEQFLCLRTMGVVAVGAGAGFKGRMYVVSVHSHAFSGVTFMTEIIH
jgi:hypothetical protein